MQAGVGAAPVLVLAVGNESRGDDALGPLLARRCRDLDPNEVEVIEDFQLHVEHVVDLVAREVVLFIDAGMRTPAPYAFYRVEPAESRVLFTHAQTPEAVLGIYRRVYHADPPPSFVLCVRGERFELGANLSDAATKHLEAASALFDRLIAETQRESWVRYCAANPPLPEGT